MLTSPQMAAVIDVAFIPAATWPLYQVLKKSGNRRNLFLVGLLALLATCNALYHGAVNGWLSLSSLMPLKAAILIIVLILLLIGALPNWGYSRGFGYGPSGILGVVLVVIIILVLMQRI